MTQFNPGDHVALVNWLDRPESGVYENWGNEWIVTSTPAMPGYDLRINHIGNDMRHQPGDFSVKYNEIQPL